MTFLFMLFFHIVDDYYLQGILAKMKQRSWWKENAPEELYRYDWLVALLMHSLSWAFMIMLPIAYRVGFSLSPIFLIVYSTNVIIHGMVDHFKANKKKISLITDQTIHILQILYTYVLSAVFLF